MRSVWKFPLRAQGKQSLYMPLGAKILSVGPQGEHICLWADVDTEANPMPRDIFVFGTGHEMPEGDQFNYLGTAHLMGGSLVLHVFERLHLRTSE